MQLQSNYLFKSRDKIPGMVRLSLVNTLSWHMLLFTCQGHEGNLHIHTLIG